MRGTFSVENFCALKERADIDAAVQGAERNLAAARSADSVRRQAPFDALSLPEFDTGSLVALLQRDLPNLEASAADRVQEHLKTLGDGGEIWVADGMERMELAAAAGNRVCPFCAQDLGSAPLIAHYQAYFSAGYEDLKQVVARELANLQTRHSGEVVAAFERSIRVAIESRQFWSEFTEVPDINLDTAAIARAWKAVADALLEALRGKQAAPLERTGLPAEVATALASYETLRADVAGLSEQLQKVNEQIAIVKEKAAAANVATLTADLALLRATKLRYQPEIATLCDDYIAEQAAKAETEKLRDRARADLDEYRTAIFPEYEVAINSYLQRFNAGFRLTHVTSVNTRGGSAVSYNVLINAVPVPLASGNTPSPSFRNTLSAGDRNALALAFFFASLDRDPNRAQKIVVIDDPINSLDEHRALTTVQEMRRLVPSVNQVILLSHSKPFLCSVWEGADKTSRTAIKIDRGGAGSTLSEWDVNDDCITEHDRNIKLVRDYLRTSNAAEDRAVATALRPILEAFMRVAYSDVFVPGMLLGPFLGICEQRVFTVERILTLEDIAELRDLLD